MTWGPHEELIFSVESWSLDGNRIEEILGRLCNVMIAHAAYQAAKKERPKGCVRLRYGTHLIRDSVKEAAEAQGIVLKPEELQPRRLTEREKDSLRAMGLRVPD